MLLPDCMTTPRFAAIATLSLLAFIVASAPVFASEGRAWGDIHVRTIDGAIYPFQAAGEFVASRSTAGDLEVQLRLESAGFASNVSVATAVAVFVDTTPLSVALGRDSVLFVDGRPARLENDALDLPGGGRVERTERGYEIFWSDGSMLTVDVRRRHLDAFLRPAEARRGTLSGLFGNFNGIAADDIEATAAVLGSGSLSPVQVAAADLVRTLLSDDDPRLVNQETSLFQYARGQTTAGFRRPPPAREATPTALSRSRRRRAKEVCTKAGVKDPDLLEACIVDVGYTGDDSFAESSLAVQERDAVNWDSTP